MEREIINSEAMQSIGYDVENSILEIEFKKNGVVWQYMDFPEVLWHEFYNSESKGRYFYANIKGKYAEVRVA
jgi:hypothetical protein